MRRYCFCRSLLWIKITTKSHISISLWNNNVISFKIAFN
jgi:hypothetical protein